MYNIIIFINLNCRQHNSIMILHAYNILAAVVCLLLVPPENGDVQQTGDTYGSTASYSCDHGYRLEGGESQVACLLGGWSGDPPLCTCKFISSCTNTVQCSGTSLMWTPLHGPRIIIHPHYREVSLFQRLICTQKYTVGTSETE